MKGNEAVAEAAILAGCRFFAGYPITPQNEIPEYMSRRMPAVGGVFLQGESETASVCMVYGAASMGTLAMTSSSGPGISLKAEGISTLAGACLPAVIVNVMRGGPGLGAIQAAQSDYLQATKALGHGGFRVIVLAPSTVQEAIDLTYKAFELAVQYRNPVMVLMDGWIGSMMEPVTLPEAKEPVTFSYTGWGAKYFNPSGVGVNVVTSCLLEPEYQELLNIRAGEMYGEWKEKEVLAEEYLLEDAEYVIVAYGTAARAARTAIGMAEIMHAANRGENFTVIFINNSTYGMTGGQMAPTTLVGQKATTAPLGRNPAESGYPVKMCEILSQLEAPKYIARFALDCPANILKAKKGIRKAFEMQMAGKGFTFVELLSNCPTNWGMPVLECLDWMRENTMNVFPLGVFRDGEA